MPGWAWAIISVAVGLGVMTVASILAITFLGSSAESRFSSVGSAVDSDRGGIVDVGAENYGDSPQLDALWDQCEGGSGSACDQLFWTSPVDSAYEEFGNTCGHRFSLSEVPLSCADEIGG